MKTARTDKEACDSEVIRIKNEIRSIEDQCSAIERQHISPMKLYRKFVNEISTAFEDTYKLTKKPEVKQEDNFT